MANQTRGIVGIVYAGNINQVKAGMKLILEEQYNDDLTISTVVITDIDTHSVSFEQIDGADAGCRDYYDINCFKDTVAEEAEAWQRLYFIDEFIAGEYALLNVEKHTIVMVGTMDEVTAKVLDMRQGLGAKGLTKLRVVCTTAFKEVKLKLEL